MEEISDEVNLEEIAKNTQSDKEYKMSFGVPASQQENAQRKDEAHYQHVSSLERGNAQPTSANSLGVNQKVMLNKIFELLNSSNDMSSHELGTSFSRDLSFVDRKKNASPAFMADFSPHESANLSNKSARSWSQVGKSFSITGISHSDSFIQSECF